MFYWAKFGARIVVPFSGFPKMKPCRASSDLSEDIPLRIIATVENELKVEKFISDKC